MLICIVLSIIACTLCQAFGSYTRRDLSENNMYIDRVRRFGMQQIQETNVDSSLIPISAYSQLVNGLNWKIIYVSHDKNSNAYNLIDSTVYTGPFQATDFKPEGRSSTLTGSISEGADAAEFEGHVTSLFGQTQQGFKVTINTVRVYPNVVNQETFYLVNSSVSAESGEGSSTFTHDAVFSKEDGKIVIKRSLTLA
jgi:hypothetical protein